MKPKKETLRVHFNSYNSNALRAAGVDMDNTLLSDLIYELHSYEINPAIEAYNNGEHTAATFSRIEETWALMHRIEKHYLGGSATDGDTPPEIEHIQGELEQAEKLLARSETRLAAYRGYKTDAEYAAFVQKDLKEALGWDDSDPDLDLDNIDGYPKELLLSGAENALDEVKRAQSEVAAASIDYEKLNAKLTELHENNTTLEKIVLAEGKLEPVIRELKLEADLALKAAHNYNPENAPFIAAFAPIRNAEKYEAAMKRFIALDDAYREFQEHHPAFKSDQRNWRAEYAQHPHLVSWETVTNGNEVCSEINSLNSQLWHLYVEGYIDDNHLITGGEGGTDPTIDMVFHEIIDALQVERQRCERFAQFSIPDSVSAFEYYTKRGEEIGRVENNMVNFSNTLDAAIEESLKSARVKQLADVETERPSHP